MEDTYSQAGHSYKYNFSMLEKPKIENNYRLIKCCITHTSSEIGRKVVGFSALYNDIYKICNFRILQRLTTKLCNLTSCGCVDKFRPYCFARNSVYNGITNYLFVSSLAISHSFPRNIQKFSHLIFLFPTP